MTPFEWFIAGLGVSLNWVFWLIYMELWLIRHHLTR